MGGEDGKRKWEHFDFDYDYAYEERHPDRWKKNFCAECHNLLHPKEDKEARMLMLVCRTCDSIVYPKTTIPQPPPLPRLNESARKEDEWLEIKAGYLHALAVLQTVEHHTYNQSSSKRDPHQYWSDRLLGDPTLPRKYDFICDECNMDTACHLCASKTNTRCNKCARRTTAVYLQLPEAAADDAITMVYYCMECRTIRPEELIRVDQERNHNRLVEEDIAEEDA